MVFYIFSQYTHLILEEKKDNKTLYLLDFKFQLSVRIIEDFNLMSGVA